MMMGGYGGYGLGFGLFQLILTLLFLGAIIVGIVLIIRALISPGATGGQPKPSEKQRALELLEERYAKGEIDRDEFLEKKRDLEGA